MQVLLVLVLVYADVGEEAIYFAPEPKKYSHRERRIIWDINSLQNIIGTFSELTKTKSYDC